ncbi:exodeoxyribonuclease VII large subunit [Variovorax sp. GT1P44]|uniref:exodeoxyribonuclease VII large subunit n=1 Tax=Variovorax sp. GT1P44 TaxID=3443742 RepID=UPI003F4663CE
MDNTYLTVPFSQKDKAKAQGARWDTAQKKWYVPAGLELAPFQAWLPAGQGAIASGATTSTDLIAPIETSPTEKPTGVSLSQLLAGVERAVAQAYQQGVWTRVDVVNVTTRNKHVYLELSERDESGSVVAQARGAIWARTADRIVPEFERATGAQLAPGIKLLVLAKPGFKAQYGFSIEITGIDSSYTLGDLEAQKRKIREQLQAEQILDRNKRLPAPWDFSRVLVVAPQGAAGLGDFDAEAKRLHAHRVCEFLYAHSRFQGAGAPAEILAAIEAGIRDAGQTQLDALIIIRGGGAVNDLAWLNDYNLARFICRCDVPVLTGIGHERDSTILDEVAHRSFDTPSKVVAAVEKQIALRAREAKDAYDRIIVQARRFNQRAAIDAERLDSEIRASARATLTSARTENESGINQVRLASQSQVHEARHASELAIREVQDEAKQHLAHAKQATPGAMASVKELSTAAVRSMKADVQALLPAVLEQSETQAHRARHNLATTRLTLFERAQQAVKTAKAGADGLVREVTGQGPKKTLARGFAVVKTKDGKTVTSARAAKQARRMEVTFNDGVVQTTVHDANTGKEGAVDGQ